MRVRTSSLAITALLATGALAASPVAAETVLGTQCQVKDVRVTNTGDATIREKLWGFTGEKAPVDPVFGWIDVACADRGYSKGRHQDFGRRLWFNVAGLQGSPIDKAKISFGEEAMRAEGNSLGVTVAGLDIFGEVAPKHACVYVVTIWAEACPNQ